MLLYAFNGWEMNNKIPVTNIITKPFNAQGKICLETSVMGTFLIVNPKRRRSMITIVPTDNESPRTWVVSIRGKIQMDSRIAVPKFVSCSHWHKVSSQFKIPPRTGRAMDRAK